MNNTLTPYSMVTLTLTRDNMGQVLQLSELLWGRTDLFTYNRPASMGEGADLAPAPPEDYRGFLAEYLRAAANPCMGIKDSLFNIPLREQGWPLFGGCAGYCCGAAFNFVSLLPDGMVHACRKFVSPIGNMLQQYLATIYEGETARRIRRGSAACRDCSLRPVCGGCPAVSRGLGLDPLSRRDPYCFM